MPTYKIAACGNTYAGIQQRWLVIESQARLESDKKLLAKPVAKQLAFATTELKQLSSQQFACKQSGHPSRHSIFTTTTL